MRRSELFIELENIVGPESFRVVDSQTGWPGRGVVNCSVGEKNVTIHIGPIGLSQRNRDDVERRFQNPGQRKPLVMVPNSHSNAGWNLEE